MAATIVGLATDVCVKHTAADALPNALVVTIVSDAVRGIDADDSAATLRELAGAGARASDRAKRTVNWRRGWCRCGSAAC